MPAFFSKSVLYVRRTPPVYQGSVVWVALPLASLKVADFQNDGTKGFEASGSLVPTSSR